MNRCVGYGLLDFSDFMGLEFFKNVYFFFVDVLEVLINLEFFFLASGAIFGRSFLLLQVAFPWRQIVIVPVALDQKVPY